MQYEVGETFVNGHARNGEYQPVWPTQLHPSNFVDMQPLVPPFDET